MTAINSELIEDPVTGDLIYYVASSLSASFGAPFAAAVKTPAPDPLAGMGPADIIACARYRQNRNPLSLKGKHHLSPAQRTAVHASVAALDLEGFENRNLGSRAMHQVLERFEELCRRNALQVPDYTREGIAKIFLRDLLANAQAFFSRDKPSQMVSATLYNGDLASLYSEAEFSAMPSLYGKRIFKHALKQNPENPRDFLRRIPVLIAELKAQDRFAPFLESTPGIFNNAAISRPDYAEIYLDRKLEERRHREKPKLTARDRDWGF